MADHPYDNPKLMPKEFLLAVMHDKSISLHTRMDVAVQLLKQWPNPWDYVPPAITIRIEGLGNNPPEPIGRVQVHVQADDEHGSGPVGHA
jgi:hypothetical protein